MFGLLFASALSVTVVAAWPIYLHFRRRRNMRVQAVPSLRLFGFTKRKSKRIRVQQLFLLVMRVAFILALGLLLAQPFLASSLSLPLPPVAGEQEDEKVVAIIVDDSVSSMHGDGAAIRLERSKQDLATTIETLPDEAGVSFTLTTSPYPSPVMSKADAVAFLGRLQSIPRSGNAVAALRNTLKTFSGKPVALIASTPLNRRLWEGADGIFTGDGDVPLRIHDTSAVTTSAYIIAMEGGVLKVGGSSEALKGSPLIVRNAKGEALVKRPLTAHEALLGEVVADMPEYPSPYYSASIGEGVHPWQILYFQTGTTEKSEDRVVIVRNRQPEPLLLDQLLTGVILAFHGDAEITHYDPRQRSSLPLASTIVVLGQPEVDEALLPWFRQCIQAGVRILAIPSLSDDNTGGQTLDFLPQWSSVQSLADADFPISLEPVGSLPDDQLTVLEVRSMRPKQIRAPIFDGAVEVALTAGRTSLLVKRQLGYQSYCWAFGAILDNTPDSVAWHPAFPVLIDHIMFPAKAHTRDAQVTVGDIVRADEWFGTIDGKAMLISPSARQSTLQGSGNSSDYITVNEAGGFALERKGVRTFRVANLKREEELGVVSRGELQRDLVGCELTWFDSAVTLNADAFRHLTDRAGDAETQNKQIDLSPIAFWALMLFLIIESILLYISWRRKAVVAV